MGVRQFNSFDDFIYEKPSERHKKEFYFIS